MQLCQGGFKALTVTMVCHARLLQLGVQQVVFQAISKYDRYKKQTSTVLHHRYLLDTCYKTALDRSGALFNDVNRGSGLMQKKAFQWISLP